MSFSMMMVAMALVMWVICLGLAPAWIGPFARSRGPRLQSLGLPARLRRSRLERSRQLARFSPATHQTSHLSLTV